MLEGLEKISILPDLLDLYLRMNNAAEILKERFRNTEEIVGLNPPENNSHLSLTDEDLQSHNSSDNIIISETNGKVSRYEPKTKRNHKPKTLKDGLTRYFARNSRKRESIMSVRFSEETFPEGRRKNRKARMSTVSRKKKILKKK